MADRIQFNGRTYIPLTPINGQRINGARPVRTAIVSPPGSPPPGPGGPEDDPTDGRAADRRRDVLKTLGVTGPVAEWLATKMADQLFARMVTDLQGDDGGDVAARARARSLGLTERELQKCKAKGIDPEKYAATKRLMGGK